ncbi:hypothetical protein C0J50_20103 [Silurus asotus]|uniref:Reverse transcriptase domain-containing protein n=1 Tax=Silurus asotus TaxID=30991 RepID=A0AAD5AP63_SILAS|nr:hypothetical protein C0J50_20103 [Silurus asotus]
MDFLTRRSQAVQIGNSISSTTTLSTGAPQGCVLSPLLSNLLTHDCEAMHNLNHIIECTDDTTVMGLISKNEESYREEVQQLTAWYCANKMSLNIDKTKEMFVDFRRAQSDHSPVTINGSSVKIIESTKFIAGEKLHLITQQQLHHQALQHLYFLRRLRKAHLPPPS